MQKKLTRIATLYTRITNLQLTSLLLALHLLTSARGGPAEDGQWGPVISWPHIPVSAANLPDGRILTWASNERTTFPANPVLESTYTAIWNPTTNQFEEIFHEGHDMFCAHLAMLEDGRVFVNGGNSSGRVTTTLFDFRNDQWTQAQDMNRRRWYNTTVAMPDGTVFTMIGTNGGKYPEVWENNTGWTLKNGINFDVPILNYTNHYEQLWWPLIHIAPNGKIFHSGPTPKMHWIDPTATGSITEAGPSITGWYPKHGTSVMYDEGKILTAGGAISGSNLASTNKAMVIDLNSTAPDVREIPSMNYPRKFQNGVILPTGEVLVLGGNTSGAKFSDAGTIYAVETWSPATETWRVGASSSVPRNYHSIALLLTDGRVLSAGGGLCGCAADHQDGQIYSPDYLFNSDDSLAARPTIISAPETINVGESFTVSATAQIQKFTLIKLSSTTHAVNTDLRFLSISFTETGSEQYQLNAHANENVLTPGYWMLFALDQNGTPSVAKVVRVNRPSIGPPGGNITYLSDLNWESTTNGWGPVERDRSNGETGSNDGNSLTLNGTTFAKGLGVHANSEIVYALDGQYQRFISIVGLDDEMTDPNCGSIQFLVYADGNLVYQSSVMGVNSPTEQVDVSVDGVNELRIVVSDAGDNINCDHGDWANAYLVKNGGFTVQAIQTDPVVNGDTASYSANVNDAIGEVTYVWNFGDGTAPVTITGSGAVDHVFSGPGRYIVSVTATDEAGNEARTEFYQAIHEPFSTGVVTASSSILFDAARDRLWNVNPDNRSVSVFDADTGSKIQEISLNGEPHSLAIANDSTIWIVHSVSAGITVVDGSSLNVLETILLNDNSRPYGIVFDSANNLGYITLEWLGQLAVVDGTSRNVAATIDIGSKPRHLSYSEEKNSIYISRFVTPPLPFEWGATPDTNGVGAEVVVVDSSTLSVSETILLQHSNRADSEHSGRGIPNYLGAPVIAPDGLTAWVPSKQDNILRGSARDGQELTHDLTVRAVASYIDLGTHAEIFVNRIDLDNASVASAAAYDKYGNYLFIALEGNRQVAVIDTYGTAELFRFDVGQAPQGLTLSDDGLTLYVHNFMDRSISVFDISPLIEDGELDIIQRNVLDTVSNESLAANILSGKQFFYDARDTRLSLESYMSCASCHNAGGEDGRVWDFTHSGEGFRNTIGLNGHGEGHGFLHWSANFDEVQDFEGQIRNFAGGTGLMDDADFNSGTRSDPLGDSKEGISSDLDNLAAYVQSLTEFGDSPDRQNGVVSTDADFGRLVFEMNNCASCHSGPEFTDSEEGVLHDIGTGDGDVGLASGVDTPTLAGLWATAPYLHDGSAETVADAINAHDGVTISSEDMSQLVAYLRTIDDTERGVVSNEPPIISSPGDQTHSVGDSVNLPIQATDADGDDLTYSASGLPDGLSINTSTGIINGTIITDGTSSVNVVVEDSNGGSANTTFIWTVNSGSNTIYVSSTSSVSLDGVNYQDEDILAFDTTDNTWSLYLDGSDIGLSGSRTRDINAFHIIDDGSILMSFVSATTIPDVGTIDDSDIIRFVPISTGSSTSGTFEIYFDGSDVRLSTDAEDIDALYVLSDGRIIMSTIGNANVTGQTWRDEDLLIFTPSSLGTNTSGAWQLYFDGSDVGLGDSGTEDIFGVWVANDGEIFLSTRGDFSVSGLSGGLGDVLRFIPDSLGSDTSGTFSLFWEGSVHDFGTERIDGLWIGRQLSP